MVMGYSKYRRSKRKTAVRRRKSTGTKRKSTKRRMYRRKRTYRKRRSYRRRYRRGGLRLAPAFLAGVNAAADVMHSEMGTQTDVPMSYGVGSQTDMPSDLGPRLASEVGLGMPLRKLVADYS